MKITAAQLRSIIKEEVSRVLEMDVKSHPDYMPLSHPKRAKWGAAAKASYKKAMPNTVFGGVDWADPEDLGQYEDVNVTQVPGYEEADAAFRAAGQRLPMPQDFMFRGHGRPNR